MENLKILISSFLSLVILVRWVWLRIFFFKLLRQAAASIGLISAWWGQVRVDIQLISWSSVTLNFADPGSNLLTFFLTYLLTFFLTYLLTFFLTNLLTLFLTYLLTFFLTYLSTCFLTYLLTFFLTYQNQNLTPTASQKKPLCKLYIYLTPRSKSNIHDNFVPVNVIALSASDRPAKRQLSPKMQNACSSTHTHTTCIRPPCQKAVESKDAKGFKVPQLHLMACANHEARRLPLWFFHFFCVGGSAPRIICLPLVHSILPKRGRSTKDCSALLQLLLALRIWNRPPFICHIPLVSLHDFFHDKHQIPSMCSARRLHAHVHALSTNKRQLVAPHMLNSFGNLIGSPNEDRLRTFHHNLRHRCQTKLTSLHKKQSWANSTCCSVPNKTKNKMPSTRFRWCEHEFLLSRSMYAHILGTYFLTFCLTYLLTFFLTYLLTYLSDISFWHIFWHSFWPIFWHYFWHIFWHIFLTFFLTYLLTFFLLYLLAYLPTFFGTYLLTFFLAYLLTFFLTFFLTYLSPFFLTYLLTFFLTYLLAFFLTCLLTFFLTYLLTFFLTYLSDFFLTYLLAFFLTYLSDIFPDILPDISFDILSDKSFDIISDLSSDILPDISFDILSDISFDIPSDISSDILSDIFLPYLLTFFLTYLSDISSDISSDILSDISSVILSDISFDILSDLSSDILPDISFDILSDISFDILSDISSDILSDIFLTYLLTFFVTYLSDISSDISSDILSDISSVILSDKFSDTILEVRHATLNSQDRGWGPARHTELAGSQLRSGTPHSTHGLPVGVRHATLNSRARG